LPKLPRLPAIGVVAALKRLGFEEVRQKGSHLVLRRTTTTADGSAAAMISFLNELANPRFCAQPVAPSSQRLEALWSNGPSVAAYDHRAAEALVICTEWKRYRYAGLRLHGPQLRPVGSSPAPQADL
jgi:hypothetical protein